ncbi:GspE/PulE family protein [Victivallis sp. Marseille-Q1083]|uniref:GspE/PulE family protein n=1 Tax=Victivallis sp. Marseille-Q1083 TaxID=2717288 RepID=UPI00158903D3|nr:ATPase, T2SS/T4P/T4SS family [Victivallis sp. Marseille-Q1083]
MAKDNDFIIELLTEYGLLSQEQLNQARQYSAQSKNNLSVVDAIKELGFVSEHDLTALLAQQYGMEMLDLDHYEIPDEVLAALTPDIVSTYNVIPVMKTDESLTVAMSDPTDMGTIDALRYLLGCDVEAVIAPEAQITRIIERHYRTISETVKKFMGELAEEEGIIHFDAASEDENDETAIIRLVTLIITEAYKMHASDIHLEPMEKSYRIRYRIDGVLREVEAPPKYWQPNLTSRVKIMARLDITEKRIPQDGRIQMSVGDRDIDLRVSSVPTTHGESIVMRILDKASIQLDIPKLGFYADDLELVNRIISFPDGIFLVTGPTGSGKTTSLYAFLNTINTTARKIITVEDPVEYLLPGINQVQVDRHVNMTFAAALRAMLRQAPNIIMVGEIRDLETAEIAINAALTGHLVFSTLHTNDAPTAITRLVDMGVAPFLVASSLRAVMAQRLLRRACKNCLAPHKPTPMEARLLGLSPEYLATRQFYKGTGCERCSHTGYKGRIGIYEIFTVTDDIAALIFKNSSTSTIRDAARRNGMRTLRDDALRKAEAGTSTLEEVIRVTMMDAE